MYSIDNYIAILEAKNGEKPAISGKIHQIVLGISDEDLDDLMDLSETGEIFTRLVKITGKNKKATKVVSEVNLAIAVANSNKKRAIFPSTENVDISNTIIIYLYPKQLDSLEFLDQGPVLIEAQLKRGDNRSTIGIQVIKSFNKSENKPSVKKEVPKELKPVKAKVPVEPKQEVQPVEDTEASPTEVGINTGQLIGDGSKKVFGANPKKKKTIGTKTKKPARSKGYIKGFDAFVNENIEKSVDLHPEVEKAIEDTTENNVKIDQMKRTKKGEDCKDCDDVDAII